ncbi:MAG: PAS domain-containing protein, partial [Steroidobacteraceae bacterium]
MTEGTTSAGGSALRPVLQPFRAAASLVLLLAAVLAFCWLLYIEEANRIVIQQAQRETVRVSLLSQLLLSELRPVADDLRLLADGDSLRRYLDTGDETALQLAIRRATFMSERKPAYDQLRFIDTAGQEVMRVNSGGGVVTGPQLQSRADSRFFILPNALPPGSLYISAIDLTVDYGQVTMPPRPVMRMAMPVFDTSGRRRGVYIVNFLAANMIASLQIAEAGFRQRLRLLNDDGYWLKAADPAQEWGFELPERAAFSLAKTDPALWMEIQQQPTGQRRNPDSLFTWQHVLPGDFAGRVTGQLLVDEAYLIIGSELSQTEWPALFVGLRQTMWLVAGGLVLLALVSFWLFLGRRRAIVALRSVNQHLEQLVHERTQALEQSFEQLQYRETLLEETGRLAKVGGWDLDTATGVGRWTAEVARIHGVDGTLEFSKEKSMEHFPGESRQRLEAALQKSLSDGSPYDIEVELISDVGEHKWVRTISSPVMENGKVRHLRGALLDITDRKLADLRLNAQLQRMHLLERTTRAISERQDLASILQVVIRTLEEQMPLDFGCICLYDPVARVLTVAAVGIASTALAGR